jgi:hypothetical protein
MVPKERQKKKKRGYWRCKMMKPKDYPHSPYMKQWACLVLIHIDIEKKNKYLMFYD